MRYTRWLPVLLAAVLIRGAYGQGNPDLVQRVASGELKEAKASWWGFDPEDSTTQLQAAIDSGVPKLTIDNLGKPWIVRPIQLRSNQAIVFEEGVELLAKRGEFKGGNDSLLSAANAENITLIGYGAVCRMWKQDYDNRELYSKAEWRHCLQFKSCANIKVYGLTLASSGGDGIYLGTGTKWVTNKGVHIKDVVCVDNYRQGISVITAEDLLIENTVLRDTGGTAPQAGIDFEPNHPEERLKNVVMRDCVSENNGSYGYVLYLPPLNATSEPVSVRFENCRSIGDHASGAGVVLGPDKASAVGGLIEFVDCVFENCGSSGITVSKPADQGLVRFERCQILNPAASQPQAAPIVLSSRRGGADPMGSVAFVDVLVRDALDRNPMLYLDQAGGVPIQDITGSLIIDRDGRQTKVELTPEVLGRWMPAINLRAIPRLGLEGLSFEPLEPAPPTTAAGPVPWPRLRGEARWLLYAREGDEVRFVVRHLQLGRYAGSDMPVIVTDPDGNEVHRAAAPFMADTPVSFTAPVTGNYRIVADARQNMWSLADSSHPVAICGDAGAIHFVGSAGDFQFYVPAGTRVFGVRVMGEGIGEAIRAALLNPAGEVLEEVDNQAQAHQFEVELPGPSSGEVWTIRLAKPTQSTWEDHYVDLRGVPPLLTPAGVAPLVPKAP